MPVTLSQAHARCAPAYPGAPTAGSGDGKSGTADISRAARATAPPCPKTAALHSIEVPVQTDIRTSVCFVDLDQPLLHSLGTWCVGTTTMWGIETVVNVESGTAVMLADL